MHPGGNRPSPNDPSVRKVISMNIPDKILNTLTDEQKKKIKGAKTPEEFLSIARETGYELSEEQLDAMSGGWCPDCREDTCPYDF